MKERVDWPLLIGGFAGAVFIVGWILFLTYNAVRPDSWPYLGLWSAFGVTYLFRHVAGQLRGGR